MSIDLSRFSKTSRRVIPVKNGSGQIGGRKFKVKAGDGWYVVSVGDTIKIDKSASQLEIYKELKSRKNYKGYAIADEMVPINFDVFKREGFDAIVRVIGLESEPLTVVESVRHDNGLFYFFEEDHSYAREVVREAQGRIKEKLGIASLKNKTPELQLAFIISNLLCKYNSRYDNGLHKYFNIPKGGSKYISKNPTVLIREAAAMGGARVDEISRVGDIYNVTWSIGGQKIKSSFGSDLRVIDAGFCLNNDDTKHTMNSITVLAKMFQEDDPLYITRE